jgi:TolB-like protein/Tfp pilus assembly protein PilF/DNA-binding winged helix-turn-helix (wHTH) protein
VGDHFILGSEMKDASSASICLRVLGSFEVVLDGVVIPKDAWPRRKTRNLLKVLLTAPGDVFTVDQLIEAVLPDADVSRAGSNIRARISELRRVLEPNLRRGADSQHVRRVGEGYAFNTASDSWVDTLVFQQGITEAQRIADEGRWEEAVEAFEAALTLYRGEFLAEDRYAEWAEATRSDLRCRYLDAQTRLAACYAELGRLRQAISCCQRILSIEPHRESVIRQLMEYQHEAGQRAQALDTYNEGERALREYLDVDPSPETLALHKQISSGESKKGAKLDPRRIAVLPLQNYSPDPEDDYFANGMTEELIGCISKIKDLRVIARTSVMRFKDTTKSVSEIGCELNAGTLLEGSVRKTGDKVRISAQLIDARTEEHLWADEYDGDLSDIFAIQRDVARKVAHALEVRLVSKESSALQRQSIEDITAHTLYLKGLFFQVQHHPVVTRKGRAYLEKATELDPAHARAFAALADAYTMVSQSDVPIEEAYRKAKTAVTRALEIDGDLAEAHTALGLIQLGFEHDAVRAKESFDRAIDLSPSHAQAYNWQGFRCAGLGQYDQAIISYKTAIALDPLSPYHLFNLARSLAKANRFDEAFTCLDKALEINPTHRGSMGRRIWCNHLLRNWEAADAAIKEFCHQHGESQQCPRHRGLHLLYLGKLDESHTFLQLACERGIAGSSFHHADLLRLAKHLICARRFDESIEQIDRILLENPSGMGERGHVMPLFQLGVACEQLGRYDDALSALNRASGIFFAEKTGQEIWIPSGEYEMSIWIPAAMGMVHAAMGKSKGAQGALEGLRTCPENKGGQSARAVLCFRLGLVDEGFAALDLAVDNHDWFILTIKTHPWFDPVRADPRFAAILKRMNLAD